MHRDNHQDVHPFASDTAAGRYHILADDLSPAEALNDPIPAAWQIIIAMTCGALLGAAGWFATVLI